MKFTINIECTPDEARQFFGLPDLKPFQEEITAQMQAQIAENMKTMDPQEMMQSWLPGAMTNFTEMQKSMWDAMTRTTEQDTPDEKASKD